MSEPMKTTAEEILVLLADEIARNEADLEETRAQVATSFPCDEPLNNMQYREIIKLYHWMQNYHNNILLIQKLINEIHAHEEEKRNA